VELGPLRFVAKVDRVDRFPDGTEAILDYKTGQVSKNPWDGPRPADPQLPIYAVSHPQPVSELLFALVSRMELGWSGVHKGGRIDVDGWRTVLEKLATDFANGEAAVDPKLYPVTCEYCDASPVCRVGDHNEGVGDGE
jgi:hypothetical protein